MSDIFARHGFEDELSYSSTCVSFPPYIVGQNSNDPSVIAQIKVIVSGHAFLRQN